MNDPNKRIDIDKSSLLSLKAELLRKQQEVNIAKSTQSSASDFVPRKPNKPEKSSKSDKSTKTNILKTNELEDSSQLARSKKILEAKARYYEKMMKSGGSLNNDDSCLVMFNQKYQDEKWNTESESDDEFPNADYPEDDWIEYTDCLGRTRKCLKKDLPDFQKRDSELSKVVEARNQEQSEMVTKRSPSPEKNVSELDKILKAPDPDEIGERFIEQREQWEKQEVENAKKEFVHYQDVLFDEAREHGVGYYAFSNDEEERRKQQKELDAIRKTTLAAQKQKEELRNSRDKIIADRVKAAKARQRARLGLPPEKDEPEQSLEIASDEKPEENKQEKILEEQAKQREIEEQLRSAERKSHVRPWDKNKTLDENEEWQPRVEKLPVSQDVWNEQKRAERKAEFAPPQEISYERPIPEKKVEKRKNKFDYSYQPEAPPGVESYVEDRVGSLYFTTKKQAFKRKNYESGPSTSKPVQIKNELSSDEDEELDNREMGAAVPPPPSWDYYTPEQKRPKTQNSKPDWEKSIEAGLRYLREQSDKAQPTTKNKWTANADY